MSSTISSSRRRIAVVTGTRAEFGLLRSVMQAVAAHKSLELNVLVTGTHLLPPENTIEEVRNEFAIAATVPMQSPQHVGRIADAEALGRGITGFAEIFAEEKPDVVLVLGDRIEAFAAAAAASVAGIRVAHMHGGDRAQGIADEAMRHAITKLSHIHFPATTNSAMRIIAMGEEHERVHVVGSPAMDGLNEIPVLDDGAYKELGAPDIVVLLHPTESDDNLECQRASSLLSLVSGMGPLLAMYPNHDPGRNGIVRAIEESKCHCIRHLSRGPFIGLLRRAKVLIGNSSAALIECSAVPIRAINIGPRQSGREQSSNVKDIPTWDYKAIQVALSQCLKQPPLKASEVQHPYGDGQTGIHTAKLLAELDLAVHAVCKRNVY